MCWILRSASVPLVAWVAVSLGACGHGHDASAEIGAMQQELEGYRQAVYAATTVVRGRELAAEHHASVNERMARMHGLGMGMSRATAQDGMMSCQESGCVGMGREMDAHHQAMDQGNDLGTMRAEVERHRTAMMGLLEAQRQHHGGGMGMM